jgi:pimeloyl-ACP methyl ester carboxylesterase
MRTLGRLAMLLACVVMCVRCAGADTSPPAFTFQGTMPVYFWLTGGADGQESISVRAGKGNATGSLMYREHQVAVDANGVTEVYDTAMTATITAIWDTVTPGASRFVGTADCAFLGLEYFDGVLGVKQAGSGTAPIEIDMVSAAGSGLQGTIHALDGGSMILINVPEWDYDYTNPTTPPTYNPSVLVGTSFYSFVVNSAANLQLEAVDPLPDMMDLVTPEGGLSASDQQRLATQGQPVSGPAADGATRVLLRASLPAAGNVTFSLGGVTAYGSLSGLDGAGPGNATFTTAAQLVPALGSYYAFALYQAPDGLPAGSATAAGGVPFTVSATTDTAGASQPAPLSLFLFQPPVVLLHGLWSDGSTWDKFPLNANGEFNWISAPSYPSASGLAANAQIIRIRLQDAVGMARSQGVAACRADVIGHSMGGVLGRYWASASNASAYEGPRNWYAGDIRRLITLDSPHSGSKLANEIIAGATPAANWIMRNVLQMPADDGAVRDLCVGSQALTDMGASLVPGHALVGSVDLSLDIPIGALGAQMPGWGSLFQALPLLGWGDPLWQYNTTDLFGGSSHDFIVSCDSQAGGLTGGAASTYHGFEFRHTNDTSSAAYAQECETLLTSPAGNAFVTFPALAPQSVASTADVLQELPLSASQSSDTDVPPPTLTILSPIEGAQVSPDALVQVVVQPSGGDTVASAAVLGPGSYAESSPGTPTQVSFTIPAEAAGDYPIVALAQLAGGQQAYSPPVHLQVSLNGTAPTVLRFGQEALSLEPYDSSQVSCLIDCGDGVTRLLEGGTIGLTFSSTDETVATVDSDGNVTAVAPGWCSLQAHYLGLTASLVVAVRDPMPDFRDVPAGFWAFYQIRAALRAGIVSGYPDGTYQPQNPVTRDQMAVYISRALAGGDGGVPTGPATATFSDVPIDYWAFRYVEYAVTQNVVKGYSDGTYKPTDQVTRDQMSVFVARAIATPTAGADLVNYTPPATATFPDVPTTFWAYKYVEYIAQPSIGVTNGYPDGDYHPEYICTRDQMAVYVARAFRLQ